MQSKYGILHESEQESEQTAQEIAHISWSVQNSDSRNEKAQQSAAIPQMECVAD